MKVIIAITSDHSVFHSDGARTGVYYSEALDLYRIFKSANFDITFVSETGIFGFDEHSMKKAERDNEFLAAINNLKRPSQVNAEEFAIFYATAGHGALLDYPRASGLQALATAIWEKGGILAAVGHGPAIFTGLRIDNRPLIEGKRICGYTDDGEIEVKAHKYMECVQIELIEAMARRMGAIFEKPAGPWDTYVVEDGRLVTGTNPELAAACARAALALLQGAA